MGGQLDGIFLAGSLPHEFIILIVTSFICLWLINFSLSLSLSLSLSIRRRWSYRPHDACTKLGDRAFPVTAARAWNALLPSSVRSAPSLLQFRRDLKTALHVSVIVYFTIVSSWVTDCNF